MSTFNRLVIIGTGGHAKSVFSLVSDIGYEVKFFLDETTQATEFLGIRVATQLPEIPDYQDYGYLIAIGDNSLRKAVRDKLMGIIPIESFPTIIHKSAYVGMGASIGFGTLVFPFSNIGAYSQVDEFCILNTGSILEHDSQISAYSALAPGATVGGNSQIGSGTWVGLNASVMQGIKIGDNSIVGAQSFVNKDVGSNVVVFGTPAKITRTRASDQKFL
jgi:sugar O-acyltransferase (sialic acid O-acetyltransferase NeuD family)